MILCAYKEKVANSILISEKKKKADPPSCRKAAD
jgi:hypothetical protein